jgi:hypothetical protein
MATLYDRPDTYIDESVEYNRLANKVRTTSGSGIFTSTTSGVTYTYTTGENDLFTQLQTVLSLYLLRASIINNKLEISDFNTFEDSYNQYIKRIQLGVKI